MSNVITGLGDKNNNINLIQPELDAELYKYIVGKNAIIYGLNIQNNSVIKAGMAILDGYRVILGEDANIGSIPYNHIYARLKFYDNKTTPSVFFVHGADGEINYETTGSDANGTYVVYAIELYAWNSSANQYICSISTPTLEGYPKKSYYANETEKVLATGTLEDGVTAVTQPKNTHDLRIGHENDDINRSPATTLYVHNQIEEEINYGTYSGNFLNSNNGVIGTFVLQRKAKYVVMTLSQIDVLNASPLGTIPSVIATIPNGFLPTQTVYFVVSDVDSGQGFNRYVRTWKCATNGEISQVMAEETQQSVVPSFDNEMGYKTT